MARAFKIIRKILFGLVVLFVTAIAGLYGASEWMLRARYDVRPQAVVIPTDASSLERGRHLTENVMHCAGCHGDDLGGKVFFDAGMLVARIPAPNLTRGRGGIAASYSEADWVRAVRHGVRPDGRPLVVMPSEKFALVTASDLAAVIAYVKSRPPVDRELGSKTVGPIGRFLLVSNSTHVLPAKAIDHAKPIPDAAPTDLVARGEHIANISGCTSCHGADLTGGPEPSPGPANLTRAGLDGWTEADFVRTLRTSRTPDNRQLAAVMSPAYGQMTDGELHALWAFLQSVPAKGQKSARQLGRAPQQLGD
jgi:mono/diheme cytochrome c family protein